MSWDESMSVGIATIDEQHRNLFNLIHRLEGVEKLSSAEAEATIDALLDYAQIHFQTEEEFFYRYDYAEKEAHEREHAAFINRVIDFSKEYERNQGLPVPEVHAFLVDWLTRHIKGSDMKFKGLFAQ